MTTTALNLNPPTGDIFIKNLQLLMHEHRINEAELARHSGIPQPTLHKILSGKTTDPRISTLQRLANYFTVTVDTLYSQNGLANEKSPIESKSIPIISWSDCLNPANFTQKLNSNDHRNWIIVDIKYSEQTFALTSRACMEPRFPKGTVLIVDSQMTPKDGDLIIVQYPNTQDATLRELSIDGPNQLLLSYNQKIEPQLLDNSIHIIGTVVQSRFNYQTSPAF